MGDNQAINRIRVESSKTRNRGTFLGSLAALLLSHIFCRFCHFKVTCDKNCHVLFLFSLYPFSGNSIGEVLKSIFFFLNPGIAKVLAVERDVKPEI